jgi:hypothetical protein
LVDTSQGNTVNLERTGNEEETRIELLQDNDTLSTVTTSEENDNGTSSDGGTETSLLGSLTTELGLRNILSGVETRSLLSGDSTLGTVLTTLNFNSLVSGSSLRGSGNSDVLTLVGSLLGVGSGTRVARYAGSNEAISRCVRHL